MERPVEIPDRPTCPVELDPEAVHVTQGEAACVELEPDQLLRVAQTDGGQCADVLVWSAVDATAHLSASATRARHGISPSVGAALWSGWPRERPLLEIVEDTAPGHDLLHPACSPAEYAAVGVAPTPSCAEVQAHAAALWAVTPDRLHDPVNLWFRPLLQADGTLGFAPTVSGPGDVVVLRAREAVRVVVNPCVDDVFGCSLRPAATIAVSAPATSPLEVVGRPVETTEIVVAVDDAAVALEGVDADRRAGLVRRAAIERALALVAADPDPRGAPA